MRDFTLKIISCTIICGLLLTGCQSDFAKSVSQSSPELDEFLQISDRADPGSYQSDAYYYYSVAQHVLKAGQIEEAIWLLEKAVALDPDSLFLKIELADILNANRQSDEAFALVDQVLSRQPDNIAALILKGKINQQLRNNQQAVRYYEKVLEIDPYNQNVYILLGRIYWDTNDFTNAARLFRQMTQYFPGVYSAYYFLGKALFSQGKYEAAADAFQKALDLDPSLEEPRMELIEINKALGRMELIPELYRQILVYHPQNYKIALAFVSFLYENNRADEAKPLLTELGHQSRQQPEIIVSVFSNYIETKQFDAAVWVLTGMLQGEPQSSDLHYLAGVAYDGLEQFSTALEHLTQVDIDSRFYPNAVVHSALLYHNTKRTELAVATLEQAIQKMPENADFYYYLSSFYEDSKRYQDAVDVLEKGLAFNPKEVRSLFRLGIVLDKIGRRQACIDKMKEVVQLEPDHTDALNYLGYTYAEMGINLDEAEALIQRALKLKPDNGYITDSLGWVFYKRGEYNQALTILLRALELVPDDPAILEHIGDVYQKLNEILKSCQFYNQALERHPEDPESIKQKIHNLTRSGDSASEQDAPRTQ